MEGGKGIQSNDVDPLELGTLLAVRSIWAATSLVEVAVIIAVQTLLCGVPSIPVHRTGLDANVQHLPVHWGKQ